MMRAQGIRVNPDPEWRHLFNEATKERGKRSQLARDMRVSKSTITRLGQPGAARSGLLYRVSLALGIRTPTTLELDELQNRTLAALLKVRDCGSAALSRRFVELIEQRAVLLFDTHEECATKLRDREPGAVDYDTLKAQDEAVFETMRKAWCEVLGTDAVTRAEVRINVRPKSYDEEPEDTST